MTPPDKGTGDRPTDDERLWILLDRYLAGDAEVPEVEAVRDWLDAEPGRAEVLDDLRRIREVAARRPPARASAGAPRASPRASGVVSFHRRGAAGASPPPRRSPCS